VLRGLGIDVDADFFHRHEPGIDWHRFGPTRIADSEFTIISVSVPWKERWEGRNDPHVGAGAVAEADQLRGIFSRDQLEFRKKVVIVELPSVIGKGAVPDDLGGVPRFKVREFSLQGLEDLIRLLTNRPGDPLPPLGEIPVLPPTAHPPPSETTPVGEFPPTESEDPQAVMNEWIDAMNAALGRFPETQARGEPPSLWLSLARDHLRTEVSDLEDQRDQLRGRAERIRLVRDEIKHILRRLRQLDEQRREWNSIWPGSHAPYQLLPAEKWNAYGAGLNLPEADHDAIQNAYELANDFNQRMQRGPVVFGNPEPDLDGLRQAFLRAETIVDSLHSEVREQGGEVSATTEIVREPARQGDLARERPEARLLLEQPLFDPEAVPRVPLAFSPSEAESKVYTLRATPLTVGLAFRDRALTESFTKYLESEVLPLLRPPHDRLSPSTVQPLQHGVTVFEQSLHVSTNSAALCAAAVSNQGIVELQSARETDPDEARRLDLDAQEQLYFRPMLSAMGEVLAALEAIGACRYLLELETPKDSYVQQGQQSGKLRDTLVRFTGELAVPAAEEEIQSHVAACRRQLARAGGLTVWEPHDS